MVTHALAFFRDTVRKRHMMNHNFLVLGARRVSNPDPNNTPYAYAGIRGTTVNRTYGAKTCISPIFTDNIWSY